MDLGLEGKVALVTASSKGLGRATAQALSQEGAKVVMCARNRDALTGAAEAMPGETLAIPTDVTDPAAPQRLVDAALDRFGALHVLVANAGGPLRPAPSRSTTTPSRPPSRPTCSPRSASSRRPSRRCGRPAGAGSA